MIIVWIAIGLAFLAALVFVLMVCMMDDSDDEGGYGLHNKPPKYIR